MKFPYTVKLKGISAAAKIYHTPAASRHSSLVTRHYESYTVELYANGARLRKKRNSFEAAEQLARQLLQSLNRGDIAALTISAADLEMVRRVKLTLAPTGKTIETIASEYVDAWKILKDHSLSAACKFYLDKQPGNSVAKTVTTLVTEFLEQKRGDNLSAVYLLDLEKRLNRFTAHFQGNISQLIGADIDTWLRGLGVGPRSRNNYRICLNTLFEFAKDKRYLLKTWDEMDSVPTAKTRIEKIEILSPDELSKLIVAAPNDSIKLYLVIGSFAGLRQAEILRLKWSNIRFDSRYIEVTAQNAKTAERRLVPILPNLLEWFLPHRNAQGDVITEHTSENAMSAALLRLCARIKTEWKHNAPRHSFISYRVAQIQNVAQVALEAGNSPRKIFSNYRELVTSEESARWFSIAPYKQSIVELSAQIL